MRTRTAVVATTALAGLALGAAPAWASVYPVTATLHPAKASKAGGSATFATTGHGTRFAVSLKGLPHGTARITLHAGTCAMASASFTQLAAVRPDSHGRARATGSVLFRGTDPVAFSDVADGQHVVIVRNAHQRLACAAIPLRD